MEWRPEVGDGAYLLILIVGVVIVLVDGQLILRGAPGYLAEVYRSPKEARQVSGMVAVLFHLVMLGVVALVTSMWIAPDADIRSVLARVGIILLLTAIGHGITMAVLSRLRQQQLDTQIMESQVATVDRNGACLMAVSYSGEPTFRRVFSRRFNVLPFGAYPCADGYAHFTGAQAAWWPNFCDVVGLPEWKTDPRFTGPNFSNIENAEIVDEGFLPWILSKTKREVMVECEGFAGTPINTMEDIVHDSHFRQRGFFAAINHPVAGRFEYPGAQFNPAKAPWRAGRAPLLGEHTEAILSELGYSRQDLVKLTQAGVI